MFVAAYAILGTVMAATWAGLFAWGPRAGGCFREVRPVTWLLLAGLVVACFVVLEPMAPHTVWHAMNHGIRRIAEMRDGGFAPDLSIQHGSGYFLLIRVLFDDVTFRTISLFSVHYIVSVVSVVLAFLLAHVLFRSDRAALLAALMLALLPLRLRLAASDEMFIVAEAYLLLTLLLVAIHGRTGDDRFFVLALGPLFLLTQTRLEMMALGPLLAGVFLVAERPASLRPGLVRVTASVVFVVLQIPRLAPVFGNLDPRVEKAPATLAVLTGGLGNPFFDATWTPLALWVLFGLGCAVLLVNDRRRLVALTACWLVASLLYRGYHGSLSAYVRTGIPSQPFLVLIAAYGADRAIAWVEARVVPLGAWPRRAIGPALAGAVAVAAVQGLVARKPVVQAVYSTQEEYAVLERAWHALPIPSLLAYLSDADEDMPNALDRHYQQTFLQRSDGRSDVAMIGLRELLTGARQASLDVPTLVYLGAPCFKIPWRPDTAETREAPDVPGWEHPLCAEVRRRFRLVPIVEGTVHRPNLSEARDVTQGTVRTIGLYRVAGVLEGDRP